MCEFRWLYFSEKFLVLARINMTVIHAADFTGFFSCKKRGKQAHVHIPANASHLPSPDGGLGADKSMQRRTL